MAAVDSVMATMAQRTMMEEDFLDLMRQRQESTSIKAKKANRYGWRERRRRRRREGGREGVSKNDNCICVVGMLQ